MVVNPLNHKMGMMVTQSCTSVGAESGQVICLAGKI